MTFSEASQARLRALPHFDAPGCSEFRHALLALRMGMETAPFPADEQAWLLEVLAAYDGSCMQTHMVMRALRSVVA